MIDKLFKENNLKVTKQRIEIINIISKLNSKATVKNIIKCASMNTSTVYRILDKMCKNNILVKCINSDNLEYFEIVTNHKHYIKCIKCNKEKQLDSCPFDNINIKDFKVVNHTLKMEGICKECMN